MAVKNYSFPTALPNLQTQATVITWASMANSDTGTPFPIDDYFENVLAYVNGTFGAGGNLRWEGSVDGGTTWVTLNDDTGAALNMTAVGFKVVKEKPLLIRPNATAGDGTTALIPVLVLRRVMSNNR